MTSCTWQTISDAAIAVLMTTNAEEKATCARAAARAWQENALDFTFNTTPPERPARPGKPELLAPADMPRRRKAGSLTTRTALLHAVAHIELNAIDLAFDIVARFGHEMPRQFTDDWISVGDDESRHFMMVNDRLKAIGSFYGDLPAHDGLWQSAMETSAYLPARLAVVPMVLEARGLDVTPAMIKQFERADDQASAEVLQIIYEEEVAHVGFGTYWFNHLADQQKQHPKTWFRELVARHFKGGLKPPFNDEARGRAGLVEDYYKPLTQLLSP